MATGLDIRQRHETEPKLYGQEALKRDTAEVLERRTLVADTLREPFKNRLLAVMSAAPGSSVFWRETIDALMRQAQQVGLRVDLLLGLSNGAEFDNTIPLPRNTKIEHVYTESKQSADHAAGTFTDQAGRHPYTLNPLRGSQHRLVAVHQAESPHAAGKIRMLHDLNRLIMDSLMRTRSLSSRMLLMDVESQFLSRKNRNDSNGLSDFLDFQASSPARVSSVSVQQTVFDMHGASSLPRLTYSGLSEIHRRMNREATHAPNPLNGGTFTGGGALGPAEDILGLSSLTKYPGLRLEDGAMAVIAREARIPFQIARDVITPNCCPQKAADGKWLDQILRWFSSARDVISHYDLHDEPPGNPHIQRLLRLRYYLGFPWEPLIGLMEKRAVNERMREMPIRNLYTGEAGW